MIKIKKLKKILILNIFIKNYKWGLGPIPNPQSPIPNPQSPKKKYI
jgi:hypothetical protein